MKKLLKLPLQIAALPLIAILLVFQQISSIIVRLLAFLAHTAFFFAVVPVNQLLKLG